MAIGRVNISGSSIESMSAFDIHPELNKKRLKSSNVLTDVGTNSRNHSVYVAKTDSAHIVNRTSLGRDGNILLLQPERDGENWWVVEYDFDSEQFRKKQEISGLGVSDYDKNVSIKGDFNRVEIKQGYDTKIVTFGSYKSTPPAYGNWISNNMSVERKVVGYDLYTIFYEGGNNEKLRIEGDSYFWRGFTFIDKDICISSIDDGKLALGTIKNNMDFYLEFYSRWDKTVNDFGGSGYNMIYNRDKDNFVRVSSDGAYRVDKWYREEVSVMP